MQSASASDAVQILRPAHLGANVRPAGQDVRAGQTLLRRGHRLRPQDVGMLAALGVTRPAVTRRPRVAVLSTGDELLEVHEPLRPGKVRDSNSYALAAALRLAGADVHRLGIAGDRAELVSQRLDEAVDAGADLLLSSAGVSVGAHDVVRAVLEAHGELSFWGVNIRPGKPLAFGSYRGVPFLGLPGNPVSALVTFEVFVRAILDRLVGSAKPQRWVVAARAEEEIRSDGRESYLRAHVWRQGGEHRARLTGAQDSGMLSSLVLSNGLLVVPAGTVRVERGEVVSVWMFDGAVVPEMPQPEPSPT